MSAAPAERATTVGIGSSAWLGRASGIALKFRAFSKCRVTTFLSRICGSRKFAGVSHCPDEMETQEHSVRCETLQDALGRILFARLAPGTGQALGIEIRLVKCHANWPLLWFLCAFLEPSSLVRKVPATRTPGGVARATGACKSNISNTLCHFFALALTSRCSGGATPGGHRDNTTLGLTVLLV